MNSRLIIFFFIFFLLSKLPEVTAQTPGDLIWSRSVGLNVNSMSEAGDVNGDGYSDLFVGSQNDFAYCLSGKDGSILWSWNIYIDVLSVATLSDINNDGVNDCLAGTMNDTVYCFSGKPINGLTKILWSKSTKGRISTVASIGDLDEDGINDCLTGARDNIVRCYSGSDGTLLWSYTDTHGIKTVHSIPDVNGDGKDDCLAGGHGDRVLCISGGSSGTGELLWYYKINKPTGASVLSVTPIPDVDGDGIADCLAGGLHEMIYCFSGASQGEAEVIWQYSTGATIESVASISDVNGDGYNDCLAGGYDDIVFCISGNTGEWIWSYSADETVFDIKSILDVNKDGIDDCIAGSGDDSVHCIDGKTGGKLWTGPTVGSVICVISIPDISGNGAPDVVGGSDDSYVYVYEGGETVEEYVSVPDMPYGFSEFQVGTSVRFRTGGSENNKGYSVEYKFDWGDGNLSDWGGEVRNYTYINSGTYQIKSKARCRVNNNVQSDWSAAKSVSTIGHTLQISIQGSGTVSRDPDKNSYNHNETITLTVNPSSEYQFDRWEGDISGSNLTVDCVMDADKSVTAYFIPIPESVSSPDIPKGPVTGHVNEELTFTAQGAESNLGHELEYRFDWGNGKMSDWGTASRQYTYLITGSYDIRAQARCKIHKDVISDWSATKTVNVSGHILEISVEGSGTVSRDPDKTAYNHNETVSLTATPSSEYEFDQWAGDVTATSSTVDIVMDADKQVTANFSQITESVSAPSAPQGPVNGQVNQVLSYTTSDAESNLGHTVQYRFDWGDGSFSEWNGQTQDHSWQSEGNYLIKTQARCAEHTDVISDWSEALSLDISSTGIEKVESSRLPIHYNLHQNYPNPFNSATCITFQLPQSCVVKLVIFNMSGDLIKRFPQGYYTAGEYRIYWDSKNDSKQPLPSGLYFYRLDAGDYHSVKSMIYLK